MEYVSVLWQHLVSFLTQSCPSRVLVIIVSDRVEIILEGNNKGHPSGCYPEFNNLIFVMSLPVTFQPIFDTWEGFKEIEGDLFSVDFFWNKVIPF